MLKRILITLIILLSLLMLSAVVKTKYKALNFDNPGSKRLLKSESGSYYHFRSLPEKALKLNTAGINTLELRSFSTDVLRKPEIIVIIGKTKQSYPLLLASNSGKYQVYQPLTIPVPPETSELQVLCYARTVYLRAFNVLPPKPPKPTKLKNMVMKAHGGSVTLLHNGSSSEYFSFMPSQPLKFSVNNHRSAVVYIRPCLVDRTTPKVGLYQNGSLIQTIEFDLKRTSKYHVTGIKNLGISKKIELPENIGSSDYELRSMSDHLFIAKPVLVKLK